VVTYVANADNYKQKYDDQFNALQSAKKNEGNAKSKLNELQDLTDDEKLKLGNDIASLKIQIGNLEAALATSEIEKDDAVREVNNWVSIVKDYKETNDTQRQMMQNALTQRDLKEAELIKQDKELKDTTAALMENMAIVQQLQDESKRLLEEKTELQGKLDQYLRQFGKAIAEPMPITPDRGAVNLARPTKDIDLSGSITEVDLKNLLAEISIGTADGVKEGMRFHLTRGDKFICDIVVLDAWPERAVGWIELLQDQPQNQPKIDDKVSTNL
jgi:DNA repair exonuclease SbcCD ATPase subunit